MPWEIRKIDDRFCVVKKGTRTPVKGGCHPTRQAARKHQKALYANVKDASKRGS